MKNLIKLSDKGHLFWRKQWYSYCSAHREYDKDCNICQHGTWENVWKMAVMGYIYDKSPVLWMWLVNDKKFKKGRWKDHVETHKMIS